MPSAKLRRSALILPIFISVVFIVNNYPALASIITCPSPNVVVTALSQHCPDSQCL